MGTEAIIQELKVLQNLLEEKEGIEQKVVQLKESVQQELTDYEQQLEQKITDLDNKYTKKQAQMKEEYDENREAVRAEIKLLEDKQQKVKRRIYEEKRVTNDDRLKELQEEPAIISFVSKLEVLRMFRRGQLKYLHPIHIQEWFFYVIGAWLIYFILSFMTDVISVLFIITFLVLYPAARIYAVIKRGQESSRYDLIWQLKNENQRLSHKIFKEEDIQDSEFITLKNEKETYDLQLSELENSYEAKESEEKDYAEQAKQLLQNENAQALLETKESKIKTMNNHEYYRLLQDLTEKIDEIDRPTEEYKTLEAIRVIIKYLINDQVHSLGEAITRYDEVMSKTLIANQEIRLLQLQEEKLKLEEERAVRKESRWNQQLDDEREQTEIRLDNEEKYREKEIELQRKIEEKNSELKQAQLEQEKQYNMMRLTQEQEQAEQRLAFEKEQSNEMIQLKVQELENSQAMNQRQIEIELKKLHNDELMNNVEWKAKESRLQEVESRITYANKMEDGPRKLEALQHLNRVQSEMLHYLADEAVQTSVKNIPHQIEG